MKCQINIFLAVVIALWTGAPAAQTQRNVPPPAQSQVQTFNPVRAIHDVEVGKFYMKRGDMAGAIARFKDAMVYKPHYGEACLLLGQAYEKQNDPTTAITYYQKYLEILPDVPESKKVRARIKDLKAKVEKDKSTSAVKNP